VQDWTGWFMPGLAYSAYLPAASDKWGFFQGASAEFVLFSWIRKNPDPGPSHGGLYVDLDFLASTRSGVSNALHLSAGARVSLERNPSRRWLLPIFGLEAGAFFQNITLELSPVASHSPRMPGRAATLGK